MLQYIALYTNFAKWLVLIAGPFHDNLLETFNLKWTSTLRWYFFEIKHYFSHCSQIFATPSFSVFSICSFYSTLRLDISPPHVELQTELFVLFLTLVRIGTPCTWHQRAPYPVRPVGYRMSKHILLCKICAQTTCNKLTLYIPIHQTIFLSVMQHIMGLQ